MRVRLVVLDCARQCAITISVSYKKGVLVQSSFPYSAVVATLFTERFFDSFSIYKKILSD